jgi:hypothetical protein
VAPGEKPLTLRQHQVLWGVALDLLTYGANYHDYLGEVDAENICLELREEGYIWCDVDDWKWKLTPTGREKLCCVSK